MSNNFKICKRCVSDTTMPDIYFDKNGICNFCKLYYNLEKKYPLGPKGDKKINEIIKTIKKETKAINMIVLLA